MNILYLMTDLNTGGANLPVADLVSLMRAEGHTVRVLALMPRDLKAAQPLDRAGIRWDLLGRDRRDVLKAATALLRILRDDRPDLIVTSLTRATTYGAIAGWLRGIPVVSWQHNAWLSPGDRRWLRLTRRLSAFWIADSRAVATFAAGALDVEPAKFMVWPLIRARSDGPMASPCSPGMRFRVGSLGRLRAVKNFHHLIDAATLIRQTDPDLASRMEFVIGGAGADHAALAAQIARAELDNVQLVGHIDEPLNFLASLHAYAQPSHHEGLGIAAHEAMQAALPVVATRVGELQHSVLPGRTGTLIAVGDVPALASALMALARDPTRAAVMGQAGRERVLACFGEGVFDQAGRAVLARAERVVASHYGPERRQASGSQQP